MRAYHLAALLALGFWQAAPVRLAPDSTGRFRVSAGAGSGQWEDAEFDCEGNLTGASPVKVRESGARLDALFRNRQLRVTVYGGVGRKVIRPGAVPGATTIERVFGGAQVAGELRNVGAGFGVGRNDLFENEEVQVERRGLARLHLLPSAYLRLGNLDQVHFRMDVLPPSETPYLAGLLRVGLGYGQGTVRGVGGFVGLTVSPYADQGKYTLGVAELQVPAGRHLDLWIRGQAGPGYVYGQRGLMSGVRLNFGR